MITLRQLRQMRRIAVALQHLTGVTTAFGALVLLTSGDFFTGLICVVGFVTTALQRIPDVPPDD
jgi:hypothetical protein